MPLEQGSLDLFHTFLGGYMNGIEALYFEPVERQDPKFSTHVITSSYGNKVTTNVEFQS